MTAHVLCQVQDACANENKPINPICKGIISCRRVAEWTEVSYYTGGVTNLAVVGVDDSASSPPGEVVGQ